MAKRRRNGEGCFSKNGNGFDYRISYQDNSGKTKYKYFWAKTKEECLKIMSQAMEEKHVVTEDFYDSVMDRESKTTTTIGNGVSLPHGSPTAVNESKVGIAILKNPIMWDNEQVQVVFLLAFRLSTRDEISRIQMFYKEYVTLIDSEEKLEKLKSMKSNIELYKYLIQ